MLAPLSVKARVTAWFTALMLIVTAAALYIVITLGGALFQATAMERLARAVNRNSEYVEYEYSESREKFEMDEEFEPYSLGTYSIVYAPDGRILSGALPDGFPDNLPLTESPPRVVEHDNVKFYLYDRTADNGRLWVRGIKPADEDEDLLDNMTRYALLTLPFLVLIGAAGGYFIVRRAFRPIDKMIASADAINEGNDLSSRIGLPPKDDEIHRIAAAFDRMLARLERSFEAEKQFASDASHELRTPTSVILAQCEALKKDGLTKKDYKEGIEAIDRQALRMSRLVSLLLNITRFEQGTVKAQFEHADLSELVSVVCREMCAVRHDVELSTEIEKEIEVDMDVTLFSRLIENLLENAIKYGRGKIRVTLRRENEKVKLSVEDNGEGISSDELPKIWQRFYRSDKSRSGGGLGLGLFLVKQIAEFHGATITAESQLGKGSIFTLEMQAG